MTWDRYQPLGIARGHSSSAREAVVDEPKRIARAVKDHLARQHLSREAFAIRARLGKSTLDKMLIGQFSARTLAIVEAATGLRLRAIESAPPVEKNTSIAVLPLTHIGEERRDGLLADGLTEDIRTEIARLRRLTVIDCAGGSHEKTCREKTCREKTCRADARAISRDLGVDYLIEGCVRHIEGRMRVTAQLIEAVTGQLIWAERFDRQLGDVFAVQDEIARQVARAVGRRLLGEASPEARETLALMTAA